MYPTVYRSNDNFFDSIFDDFLMTMKKVNSSFGEPFPPYNLYRDKENNLILSLAFAGYTKDELSVEVDRNTIIISGNADKKDEDEEGVTFLKRRISKSSFKRMYSLPREGYNYEDISVEYKDGILTVFIPKKEPQEKEVKKIEIK